MRMLVPPMTIYNQKSSITSRYVFFQRDRSTFDAIKMPENICWTNFDCFVKLSVVPIDQFRFGKSSAPLCSNMTTIPVWKHNNIIEYFLKKIDQYLYALYRVRNDTFEISTLVKAQMIFFFQIFARL